ncbi:MAG: molybdate transport system ATP-binding protein [Actinomycetota bacterium]|nr:molybdate transport system ATP-binding protein [Actinomycetota bacterium]
MSVRAAVTVDHGLLSLRADLEVGDGETLAIVGPSGAGKTTLLRAIAGFERLQAGRVSIGGEVVDEVSDGSSSRHTPVELRRIGYVAQTPHLFPHLSALDNVAFGLRAGGSGKRAARAEAASWLERVGVDARARARPSQLSGGEARRVAMARALAPQPRLLLLDEPLTGLDPAQRDVMRTLVWSEMASFPGARLLVTHDAIEAMGVATRILVLEGGRVMQHDTPEAIAERPRSSFAAEVVGVNVVRGTAAGNEVTLDRGGSVSTADRASGPVVVVIHPRAVTLHLTRPEGSARNVWPVRITQLELMPERVRVRTVGEVGLVAEITPAAVSAMGLHPGAEVWASVKATEAMVLPGAQAAGAGLSARAS